MKIPLLVLAGTTVGLSIVCGYLLREVHTEREHARSEAAQRRGLQSRVNALEREVRPAQPTSSHSDNASATSGQRRDGGAAWKARSSAAPDDEDRRWRLVERRMLADPATRKLILVEQKAQLRASNPELARTLGITEAEYEKFLDLLATHQVQQSELITRRPDAIDNVAYATLREDQSREITALLGGEKAEAYKRYDDAQPVRRQVRQFRGRLNEGNALTDEQATRLIEALQDERERFTSELRKAHPAENGAMTTGMWYGAEFIADGSQGMAAAREQMLQQAEDYHRRMAKRAAGILSSEQMQRFEELQEEELSRWRAHTRRMQVQDRVEREE